MISNIPLLHERRLAGCWIGKMAYDVLSLQIRTFSLNYVSWSRLPPPNAPRIKSALANAQQTKMSIRGKVGGTSYGI